ARRFHPYHRRRAYLFQPHGAGAYPAVPPAQAPAAPAADPQGGVDLRLPLRGFRVPGLSPRPGHQGPGGGLMLSLVVARARNGAIGKDGAIPWHLPEDLRMFQRETTGGALIMGRRTWESLPVKPLKNRLNCGISRDESLADHVFPDMPAALEFCRREGWHR